MVDFKDKHAGFFNDAVIRASFFVFVMLDMVQSLDS
jgi:hypothetical protein